MVEQPAQWPTYDEVARQFGVGDSTVRTLLRHCVLEQTPPRADGSRRVKAQPSIAASSVEPARVWLERRDEQRSAARRRREQHGRPPDHDHVWLDTATVAAMAGLTVRWAQWQTREGRIPATVYGGQYWIHREHAEVVVAARAFTAHADATQVGH